MLAYAHCLIFTTGKPLCFSLPQYPHPFAQHSSLLGTETSVREHKKHKEHVLKQYGCGRN